MPRKRQFTACIKTSPKQYDNVYAVLPSDDSKAALIHVEHPSLLLNASVVHAVHSHPLTKLCRNITTVAPQGQTKPANMTDSPPTLPPQPPPQPSSHCGPSNILFCSVLSLCFHYSLFPATGRLRAHRRNRHAMPLVQRQKPPMRNVRETKTRPKGSGEHWRSESGKGWCRGHRCG